MQSFKSDKTKHTYSISLSYNRTERIKSKLGIDLLEEDAHEVFMKLFEKPTLRYPLLWEMLDEKADLPILDNPDPEEGETDKFTPKQSFFEVLEGQTLEDADEAFWEELKSFFQSLNPTQAEVLTQMVEKMKEMGNAQMKAVQKFAETMGMREKTEKIMEASVAKSKKQFEKEFGKLLEESQ